ncbi:MAG: S24 family peptidase [Acidobacteriota bacterium]
MGAAVVSISDVKSRLRCADWSLLELARPGQAPVPFGVLLVDRETDRLYLRCRRSADLRDLEEQEIDILDLLAADLQSRADENGGTALLDFFEDSLSGFLRIGDRTAIEYAGGPQRAADRLFDEYVDAKILPWETHLPLYGLRAAATKFGEGRAVEEEAWLRARETLRLAPGMFVARVVGKSMEPLIPDDSLCVFRGNVTGSRKGRFLLVEKFGESDFASRYTVKRYTSEITRRAGEDEAWEHTRIRLEPVNKAFEAFDLGPDEFRVIAEFVEVLESA